MSKSVSELLREYSTIISEAENTWSDPEFSDDLAMDSEDESWKNDPTGTSNLPDDSMMDVDSVDNTDPVQGLADYLDTAGEDGNDYSTLISTYLKKNNLEITPIGGLTNSEGNV